MTTAVTAQTRPAAGPGAQGPADVLAVFGITDPAKQMTFRSREVLLHAAMRGDSTRFTRQDGVEEAWRIMQPLLEAPPAGDGPWHGPWVAS